MRKLKVVLVDDHDVVRVGIREFLVASGEYEVVAEASTAQDALRTIISVRPDVVLMDIDLPGMDGVRATGEILRRAPRTRVLVLSAHCRVQDVRDAMNAGASGYVLKADEPEALMEALQHVTRGLPYLPRLVARHLSALGETKAVGGVLDVLSDRERRIFRLAADCRARPEIAHELCLSRKTVDAYLRSIRRKLGLRDRAELVRFAIGLALVQPVRWRGAHPLAGNVAGARGVGDDLVSNLN